MAFSGYNPALVALSIAIAVFASYTALDLGGRVRSVARRRQRLAWLAGAALAMGGGIWSMHFVGMLAFDAAMPVAYGTGLTALSLLIAVLATGAAFGWVSRPGAGWREVLVSGPLLGLGVAAMHYTGMAAMRMPGSIAYTPSLVAGSVLIAVTAATAALWLCFRPNNVGQKIAASLVMGLAVAGMHYTGMVAATVSAEPGAMAMGMSDGSGLDQQALAFTVAAATFALLFLSLLASSIDQQRVQRDLRASEERFRAAAEAVGDIIWTNSTEGKMQGPQPDWGRFTGQSEAEYAGYGWAEAVHPEDQSASVAAWHAAVAERRMFTFEHRVRRHDGVYRLFDIRAVPVFDPAGRIREWVGVHEDITGRREFERSLEEARTAAEQANVAKSTFIANMSHELRTPLSAIIGYSEMMLEEVEDGAADAALARDLRKVQANARHLLGLINDVLDLSKVESGKMEVFAEEILVEPVVREVAATIGTLVGRKGNRLELHLAPDLGSVRSDLTKLRQILLNLLSNAVKFTENGDITVTVRRQHAPSGDRVVFEVADTGVGMTEEQLARLFRRFEQADNSTTRRFGGTGLGLALVKAFVDMLQGTVGVRSTPGVGTTFTVALPSLAGPEAAVVTAEPAPDDGELVLVIDDDADQRDLLSRFLHREGFRARLAATGETGLALARELRPRAVLLDVLMPGIDGWSVLSALKADPGLAAIPVVMVTFADQRALAEALGAADYVMKPIGWDRFKAVMDRFKPQKGDVLIVDDDDDARTRLRTSLDRDGWAVREARDGEEGLDRLRQGSPAMVLLDLTMPRMDGFTFLQRMRDMPGCADIPVVVLTARDLSREDRRRLQGASQILNKGDTGLTALAERLCALSVHAEAA